MPSNHPLAQAEVAAILEQVREEVRARRQAMTSAEDEAFHTVLDRELQRCAEQLEYTRVVSAHWPLTGRTLWERAWFLVHRVVRRLLRWYINPIVEQQNAFNDVAARTLRLLIEAQQEVREQLAEVRMSDAEGREPRGGEGAGEGEPQDTAPPLPLVSDPPTADIQAMVEEHGRNEPPASFPDMALHPLPAQLALRQQVTAHWELSGTTAVQRVAAAVQKAIRFYLRWLINPIVEQQNRFNAALTEMGPPMLAADAEERAALAKLRAARATPSQAQRADVPLTNDE